jgi:hypothetical protein
MTGSQRTLIAASDDGVASALASTTAYVSRKRSAPAGMAVAGFSTEDRVGAEGKRR